MGEGLLVSLLATTPSNAAATIAACVNVTCTVDSVRVSVSFGSMTTALAYLAEHIVAESDLRVLLVKVVRQSPPRLEPQRREHLVMVTQASSRQAGIMSHTVPPPGRSTLSRH